jgi:hypothetical protein
MPRFAWNVDQGSIDWYRLRAGRPTASEFDKIITPKKGQLSESRRAYQCRLVAERILNWQAESLDKIGHIADGKAHEPLAVAQLEELHEITTRRVGFVTTDDGRFGASPDRVADVAADLSRVGQTIEVKCPTIPKQFEYLLLGSDDAYKAQVQGQLYVCEADKALFYSFNPRTPAFELEQGRDDAFLAKMKDCLEQFSDELEEMTERARKLGAFQVFPELLTPLDAEHGDQAAAAELDAMIRGDIRLRMG